ncbi:hypothetical protein [Planktothrix sp. FACHB-1365]|uniref:hypothetical protein n=1 Tax=Planktothrix sp. FACHB-1365 TaxID=2692855 RepID=UPI0016855FF5|nr:hypothetical protein [Planktothrix sp. FACHB-1365]MBD2484236.1 hypothetical protein [Planktothrix sp. FACHB-1365]
MRQLWFLISIGIFTVGLGGCGSPPEETASTPSPTTSPAASPEVAASPQPNATPTPGQIAPFKDPLVKEQSNVAAGAGLIQSTNPEERLNLLGKRQTGTPVAPATTTAPNAAVDDPFGVLPPVIVTQTLDPGETPEAPEQSTRTVPDLPKLPVAEPPLRWRTASVSIPAPQTRTSPNTGFSPSQMAPNRGSNPPTQRTTSGNGAARNPSQSLSPNARGTTPTQRTTSGNGAARNPSQSLSPNARGTTPTPRTVAPRRTVPTLPTLPIAQVPDLPALPNTAAPPSWRDPNPPPPPPPKPVAVQPFVPPPPSTDLAQGMEVTGVLQVGNQTKVILKAPAEPTSRYVTVGQRVSNGQVLVKRVKFDTGGEPIVIFEQNGVEIAKSVGATNPPTDQKINNISLRSSRPMS